jgi:hypothetical protein
MDLNRKLWWGMVLLCSIVHVGWLFSADVSANEVVSNLNWNFSGGMNFKSEHVSHGSKIAKQTCIMGGKFYRSMPPFCGFYLGVDAISSLDDKYNKVAPYIGKDFQINEILTFDTGYTHYFYTSAKNGNQKGSNEIYVGMDGKVFLARSLYSWYDLNNRDFSVEIKVGHSFDLSKSLLSGLNLVVESKIGYEHAKKSGGKALAVGEKLGYGYWGIGANLLYEIKGTTKAKIGVSYEGNSAKKFSWVNEKHKKFVWFNASLNYSF